ncbi:hypothetical protein HON15_04390, partial [Candidatus Woesearchaeota archaeon]|nr:hypothetical protein [Candidatus Woesearchaeota archaeon]
PQDEWANIKKVIETEVPESLNVAFVDHEGKKKQLINSYYSMNGRIIHPHFYLNQILYITGESVDKTKPKYQKLNAKFSVNGHAEGYLLDSLRLCKDSSQIVIAEGYWDALKLKLCGIPTVTFGTCKVSNAFIQRYSRHLAKFDKIVILFDTESNNSGFDGAISLATRLIKKEVKEVFIGKLPTQQGQKVDIDSYLTKDNVDTWEDDIYNIIHKSVSLSKYLLALVVNAQSNSSKIKVLKKVFDIQPHLDPITQKVLDTQLKDTLDLKASQYKQLKTEVNTIIIEDKSNVTTNKIIEKIDSPQSYEEVKQLIYNEYVDDDTLRFKITNDSFIEGKVVLKLSENKRSIVLIELLKSKNGEFYLRHLDELVDGRNYKPVKSVIGDFYCYEIIVNKKRVLLLHDDNIPTGNYLVRGMKVNFNDKAQMGELFAFKTSQEVILVNSIERKDVVFKNNEEMFEKLPAENVLTKFKQSLFYKDGKSYSFAPNYERFLMVQLVHKLNEGYPNHALIIGEAGTGKTLSIELIERHFNEGILSGGSSTIKSLVPSFKSTTPNPGLLIVSIIFAFVDEFLSIIVRTKSDDENRGSALAAMNEMLEHKIRDCGSGNGKITGQMTARGIFTSNFLQNNYHHDLQAVCSHLDNPFLSRLLIYIINGETEKINLHYSEEEKFTEIEEPPIDSEVIAAVVTYLQTVSTTYD